METVTIANSTVKKTGAKNGKPWTISEVTLSDGRKVDTFETLAIGHAYEVEITPNAKPEYNANLRLSKSKQGNAASFKNAEAANNALSFNKDKDNRITWLACQKSAAIFYQQSSATEEKVMAFAKRLYDQANGGDLLPF